MKEKAFESQHCSLHFRSSLKSQRLRGEILPSKYIQDLLEVVNLELFGRGQLARELNFKGVEGVLINFQLCGAKKIVSLNKKFRHKNKITDVLSFPIYQSLRRGRGDKNLSTFLDLGDIIVCHEIAIRQAREFMISYPEEIIHLFIHGLLHLLGYDHEQTSREEKIMFEHEARLVKAVYRRIRKWKKA